MTAPSSNPSSLQAQFKFEAKVAQNDFAALSAAILNALAAVCDRDRPTAPASLGIEFVVAAFADQTVETAAWVERATRTLIFVTAEARGAGGLRLAIASAVFKVGG